MNQSNRREAKILAALPLATPSEQQRLVAELDGIRSRRRQAAIENREGDRVDRILRERLTPAITHVHHTAATQWLLEEKDEDGTVAHSASRAAATGWFKALAADIKADPAEFLIQAVGASRYLAGQYGERAPEAHAAFMQQVRHLAGKASHLAGGAFPSAGDEVYYNDAGEPLGWDAPYDADENAEYDEEMYLPDDEDDMTIGGSLRRQAGDRATCSCGFSTTSDAAWQDHIFEDANSSRFKKGHERVSSLRRQAASCSECGATIERDPEGEENRSWHHNDGSTHDHEAKPGGDTKESSRRTAADDSPGYICQYCDFHGSKTEVANHVFEAGADHQKDGTVTDQANAKKSSRRVTAARPLYEIADEISDNWENVYFGAVPYLDAMSSLDSIDSMYGADDARSIVAYFLSNATGWRGETAKAIKAELKGMMARKASLRRQASTCSECGADIERDPEGEENRSWHHNDGSTHDHEAQPSGESKESSRKTAALPTAVAGEGAYCTDPHNSGIRESVAAGTTARATQAYMTFMNTKVYDWEVDGLSGTWSLGGNWSTAATASRRTATEDDKGEWRPYYDDLEGSADEDEEDDEGKDEESKTQASRRTASDLDITLGVCEVCRNEIVLNSRVGFWLHVDTMGMSVSGDHEASPVMMEGRPVRSGTPSYLTASRRTADAGFGPDADSQSGQAESALPDVEVMTNTDHTNLGWITDGDLTEAYTEAPADELGPFDASARTGADSGIYCPRCKGKQVVNIGGLWRNCTKCKGTGLNKKKIDPDVMDIIGEGSRRTAVSLTNVGFDGGIGSNTAHGTAADGSLVRFRLSDKDAKDLAFVMTGDLAINFSGIDVDEADIITGGENMPSDSYVDWMNTQGSRKAASRTATIGEGPYRVQVGGSGENVWSGNGMRFQTPEEATAYAHDLLGRWFGADIARVVLDNGQANNTEAIDPSDPSIVINYRTASRKTAEASFGEQSACGRCGMDIEYHGNGQWIGRGGDSTCANSGAGLPRDEDSVPIIDAWPDLPHSPDAKPVTASRKTAADGAQSYCRLCGVQLEEMDYTWYALKSSTVQRDVGQHYCIAARTEARPGEFGPDGVLAPGSPGGEGGQYDAPAGTIFDAGANPIKVASRKMAAEVTRHEDGHSSWPCNRCQTTVERYPGEGDVECPNCGTEYNASGQQLRDDWRGNMSNYDEDVSDMDGYERQYAHDASRHTADAEFAGDLDGTKPAGAAPQVPTLGLDDSAMFEPDEIEGNWDTAETPTVEITAELLRTISVFDF